MKFLKYIRNNWLFIIFVPGLLIWSLGPIVWNIIISLSPEVNLLSQPPRVAISDFHLLNYKQLLTLQDSKDMVSIREGIAFRAALKNSVIVAIISTSAGTLISIVSGYTFTRFKFAGRKLLLLIIILTMPIPVVVIAIPLIRLMSNLGLMDTHIGLSILNISFFAPLTTWMSASYIQTIPSELEDAAHIDGCSRSQAFFRIILPLSKPVIGAVAIIAFLASWNQFFLPLIFAPYNAKQVTVVIAEFVGKYVIKKSLMAAAGTISILPPVLLVLFFNKFIMSGLTKGAVK